MPKALGITGAAQFDRVLTCKARKAQREDERTGPALPAPEHQVTRRHEPQAGDFTILN